MNWISRTKRLSIYLRDRLCCAWCGQSDDESALTLDQLWPAHRGGSNEATNVVTCCARCHSSRGDRSVPTFATAVAAYLEHGVKASEILAHVEATARRALPLDEAKSLMDEMDLTAKQGSGIARAR